MRVLIVGAGYVGLPLGTELVRQGHEVHGLRRRGDVSGELHAAGIRPLAGDITSLSSLQALPCAGFDWVVNCVSSTHGTLEDYRRVYRDGARNLVQWLGASPPVKFVYTSSTGVYGQNDGSIVHEDSATEPPSETGRVLVETERVFLDAARLHNFPAVVLRVAGIYGPGRGWWLKQLLAGEARIEGDGGRALNMIHRDDVVGCIVAALEHGTPGEVYNAVDNEPVTQGDFLMWLATKLNRPLPPATPAIAGASQKRGASNKRISNQKLRQALQYSFRYPTFREGYASEMA